MDHELALRKGLPVQLFNTLGFGRGQGASAPAAAAFRTQVRRG